MPIYIHPANLIIQKKTIAQKYIGGINHFKVMFFSDANALNQEDDELFSITKMNRDEFDIEHLVLNGLSYSETSDDFVILTRYGGRCWDAEWLEDDKVFAWHKNCLPELVAKAKVISNKNYIDILSEIEQGENPLKVISSLDLVK